jgi:hypothetical protein
MASCRRSRAHRRLTVKVVHRSARPVRLRLMQAESSLARDSGDTLTVRGREWRDGGCREEAKLRKGPALTS